MKPILLAAVLCFSLCAQAQFWKKKESGDSTKTEEPKEKKGGNFLTKFVTKVAKVTGGAMQTTKVDDLSEVTPTAYYQTNLPPSDLGTAEMEFYEGWKTGGNVVVLMFTKKNSYGFCKIDGTVTVDGKPASFATMGVYSAFSSENNKPKKVEITTVKGQKASFVLQPPSLGVKILSINGSTNPSVAIDPTKEVVLQLEHRPGIDTGMIAVRLLVKSIGIAYWSEIGYFPAASRIVIPPAYFRNANNTNGSLTNFKKSYFSVVRSAMRPASEVSGSFAKVEYAAMNLDGRYLTVSPDIELSKGLNLKGTDAFPEGSVYYEMAKANAFSARPTTQVKTIAPLSVALRGILYDYSSKSSYNIGDQSYTQSTKEIRFPQLPDATWDAALEKLYTDISNVFREELGATMLPVETVKASPSYQRMDQFSKDDENTTVAVSRGYKGLKLISAFVPVSEAWGPQNNLFRFLDETGANAALKLTFDLQPAWQKNNAVMIPKLAVELAGPANGDVYPTKYFTATIIGKGVKTTAAMTPEELDRVIRRSDLVSELRKSLKELVAAEKANGDYHIVWPVR